MIFDASSNAQSVREDWGINWDESDSKWKPAPGYENHPAIWVTWYGAYEYAVWAGGALPTEAQWEYACRAGTTTSYYFGDDSNDMDDYGWAYENSGGCTHKVGQKLPNAYGLYDMHGNAEEWVYDWYEKYSGDDATDPAGPASGTQRVLRGGVYNFYARDCKSAYRDLKEPHHGWDYYGFRVVFMN